MRCFEVQFIDATGKTYVEKLCTTDATFSHVIKAAWKNLYEGKHIAATALIDTLREVEAI